MILRDGETYGQNVKCKVREWTDDINIKNDLWFRHTVLLAALASVGSTEDTIREGGDCEGLI